MRECLLSCVEQALYDKSVAKRLGDLGTMLRKKAAAKQLTSIAKLKLKARAVIRRCCC